MSKKKSGKNAPTCKKSQNLAGPGGKQNLASPGEISGCEILLEGVGDETGGGKTPGTHHSPPLRVTQIFNHQGSQVPSHYEGKSDAKILVKKDHPLGQKSEKEILSENLTILPKRDSPAPNAQAVCESDKVKKIAQGRHQICTESLRGMCANFGKEIQVEGESTNAEKKISHPGATHPPSLSAPNVVHKTSHRICASP